MKMIYVLGGGTFNHVRSHLALAAPAFGTTAKQIYEQLCYNTEALNKYRIAEVLTKMADSDSNLVTNQDVENYVDVIIKDPETRCVFFNVAMCDFNGYVGDINGNKYGPRLQSRAEALPLIGLSAAKKVIGKIRKERKDIFVVGFKTTTHASSEDQFLAGLKLLKDNSLNLVLANDVGTRNNMIIVPEESSYGHTTDRKAVLEQLVNMTLARLNLTFTRSTVVEGASLIPWRSGDIPSSLRTVVNHCIEQGAYKPFQGKTAGHFAVKIKPNMVLTSVRKTNF